MKGTSRAMSADVALRKCAATFVLKPGEAVWRKCIFLFKVYMAETPSSRHAIVALHAPSAQLPHPVGDRPPDFVGRIFLDAMDPSNGHLGLSRPRASGVEIRAGSQKRTGLSLHEQLGHIARRQPVRVGGHDRSHVGWVAFDGDLPR